MHGSAYHVSTSSASVCSIRCGRRCTSDPLSDSSRSSWSALWRITIFHMHLHSHSHCMQRNENCIACFQQHICFTEGKQACVEIDWHLQSCQWGDEGVTGHRFTLWKYMPQHTQLPPKVLHSYWFSRMSVYVCVREGWQHSSTHVSDVCIGLQIPHRFLHWTHPVPPVLCCGHWILHSIVLCLISEHPECGLHLLDCVQWFLKVCENIESR